MNEKKAPKKSKKKVKWCQKRSDCRKRSKGGRETSILGRCGGRIFVILDLIVIMPVTVFATVIIALTGLKEDQKI